jgi:O-acetylserine/cysteine efflux transporter
MNPLHLGLLLLICLAWGFHVIVIKLTVEMIAPLDYVAIRMVLLAAILAPLLRWYPGRMKRVVIGGACFGGINYVFMFSGLKLLTASIGAVLMESYVIIATLFSILFLGETVGWKRMAGIGSALLGVMVIATADGDLTGSANLPLGAVLIICAMTAEATGALYVKKIEGIPPLRMLAWFALVGCAITMTLALVFEGDHFAFVAEGNMLPVGLALGYSVLVASLFGHTSYYWLLRRVPLSLLAPSGLLITLVAVGFGVVLLGDPLTPRVILGAILVLAGVGVVLIRSNRAKTSRTEPPAQGAVEAGLSEETRP